MIAGSLKLVDSNGWSKWLIFMGLLESWSCFFILPIGSMVLVHMLTWLGYIDGIHVTIYSIHGSYGLFDLDDFCDATPLFAIPLFQCWSAMSATMDRGANSRRPEDVCGGLTVADTPRSLWDQCLGSGDGVHGSPVSEYRYLASRNHDS